MENTVLIEVTNVKAMGILHELEELHLIKMLKEKTSEKTGNLSDKYRGVFSKEDAKKFKNHVVKLRSEWKNT
ncbi:MAG: hypothetical protein LCH67_11860 [Bacteroidetes bacterium]|nr:hypothetical protein [Bacteroidota bacterium]